jgi:AcrR family transcriptional regulator
MATRKTEKALEVDAIVAAALRIADRDGLEALSMRRVADEFGVTAMALYRHVANKEDLVDLVAKHALSGLPEPDPTRDWRREMLKFFMAAHAVLVEHPAVAHIMAQRPLAGERATALADRALATLVAAGFDDDLAVEAFIAFGSYTLGGSLYQVGRTAWAVAAPTSRFDGLSPEAHPTLSRLGDRMGGAIGDELFAGGLRSVIDSYAARVPARRRRRN